MDGLVSDRVDPLELVLVVLQFGLVGHQRAHWEYCGVVLGWGLGSWRLG